MSLSKIDKNHLEGLLSIFTNNNHNSLEIVKKNHVQYGQLKMIANQMNYLKQQALEIINEAISQDELHNVGCKFKKTSGNTYYLYYKEETETRYFSMLSPEDWKGKNKDIFIGAYYYDYDKVFIKK